MQTFLNQPEACFYHVTTLERWATIQSSNQFFSRYGRIFVSRLGEFPILAAIAIEQLPEIYESSGIVFLKLPQAKNNFKSDEIRRDDQATVEWTQPFQNIITRQSIPLSSIELMMTFPFLNEGVRTMWMTEFSRLANEGRVNYSRHYITERAGDLNYR